MFAQVSTRVSWAGLIEIRPPHGRRSEPIDTAPASRPPLAPFVWRIRVGITIISSSIMLLLCIIIFIIIIVVLLFCCWYVYPPPCDSGRFRTETETCPAQELSVQRHATHTGVCEKTLLRRKRQVGRQAFRAPNQGLESSLYCWTSWPRLAQKECCFVHRHRYYHITRDIGPGVGRKDVVGRTLSEGGRRSRLERDQELMRPVSLLTLSISEDLTQA